MVQEWYWTIIVESHHSMSSYTSITLSVWGFRSRWYANKFIPEIFLGGHLILYYICIVKGTGVYAVVASNL
jgi:hypothetical protein